ncbi:DUF4169 family protein [Jiella endophytica]|uniref:DUF4169 family protein n=1 Tax=Jiella endophytica TaxID=2558362 RepID=A0A4Y8RIU5_9HYPH|nr:DUF4169 family protein [Jiella endophytica]TFF22969.1 DUF4169 family protein [Jiella endophytica]
MGDVVNLRRFRKQRLRDERERSAGENRARSGRSKAERTAERIETERAKALLDGALVGQQDAGGAGPRENEPEATRSAGNDTETPGKPRQS